LWAQSPVRLAFGRYIQKGNQVETSKKQELFQKYVSGQASDEEVDLLMHLIDEGGTDDLSQQSDRLWEGSNLFPQMEEGTAKRIRGRVMASIEADDTQSTPKSRRFVPYWLRVAAVLVPVAVFSVIFYWIKGNDTQVASTQELEAVAYVEKANPKGQKSTIILSDGSMVILNADSKLVYKERFDGGERRVVLEGEAFFDVTKDASRPFIIVTDDIATKVLGTSFNVRAYPGGDDVKVAVATGKVSVQKLNVKNLSGEEGLLLMPGEMGVYVRKGGTLEKVSFDDRDLFGWKDGLIYFKNANFIDVKARLEQWYGVTILIEKQIPLEKDFSGAYKNKPLALVLHGLAFVYDFNYEIKDKIVRIY
jgi:transmembrane sensor